MLDRWESHRSFRRWLYGILTGLVLLAAAALWGYPRWVQHNAIRLARQWLASGHYKYAVEAVEEAMLLAPHSPEPWQIAADLARVGGQFDRAAEYARQAAQRGPDNPNLQIAWAAETLRADRPDEADLILRPLPPEILNPSAPAQRLLGDIARRRNQLTAARQHFENALRLDGPGAIDEVPLGLILLNATDAVERRRGLVLLTKWTPDPAWGAVALRTLLQDALVRNDRAAVLKWAEALRLHPGCTLGDMPTCLLALAQTDAARYATVLATMEKDHAVDPKAAAQLLSWLNQIGRSADAVRWMQTLPPAGLRRPPLVVAAAEALRQIADWPALQDWTTGKDWGADAEFMRWAYGLQAARMRGETGQAEELWRTLYNHAQVNGVHALFAAAALYSWGRVSEAEALWWRAAAQEGKIATEALGSLARHYQVQRDAEGQYRVFRQLNLLQPGNAAVGNNFAFFAALTGREQRQAERIARANREKEPNNRVYLATLAFVLLSQQQPGEALALLQPYAPEAEKFPGLAFAYGLSLAGNGRKAEAHRWLDGLEPASLTHREVELIKSALAD
jgi:predicted Zn-dependent protease